MFTIQFNVEVPKMYECILCNMAVHFPRMEQSLMNLLLRILYREPNIGEGTVPNQLVCVFSDKCPQLPIVQQRGDGPLLLESLVCVSIF